MLKKTKGDSEKGEDAGERAYLHTVGMRVISIASLERRMSIPPQN